MSILNYIKSRTGKLAFNGLQAVGLSAVVGVAGIVGWQMLGHNEDVNPDTLFSSADEEIVFVARGASSVQDGTSGYSGYGEGGAVQSGIRTRLSKDMLLMEQDALAARAENSPTTSLDNTENKVSAYTLDGASTGLGMGTNAAHELAVAGNGDMSNIQAQIANIQNVMAAKQKEAQTAAQVDGDAVQAAAAALQGANGDKWGMASGMARSGGSNLNSTPLQGGSREGEVLGSSKIQGVKTPDRVALSSRSPTFPGGRDSMGMPGGNLDAGNSLRMLSKTSIDVAGNAHRSANEGTRGFLASEKLSGGIVVKGGETLTGGTGSSSDFGMDAVSSLGGFFSGLQDQIQSYMDAQTQLQDELKKYANKIGWLSVFQVPGGALWALIPKGKIKKKVEEFKKTWGDTPFETERTQGPFGEAAEKCYKEIYFAGWMNGAPWIVYKQWSKKWAAEKEEVGNDSANSTSPDSPYGSSSNEGDLPND